MTPSKKKSVWNGQAEVLESLPTKANGLFLTFSAPEVAKTVKPGQFVYVKVSGLGEPLLKRAFSVMDSDAAKGWVTLYIEAKGPGTQALAAMKEGQFVDCTGPLGKGFPSSAYSDTNLLVGGGVGVAPLYALAKELKSLGKIVHFYYGGRDANQLIFKDKLSALVDKLVMTTDDGSAGTKGVVTEELPLSSTDSLFACGPKPMLKAVAKLFPNAFVALEAEMACGIGVCMGCAIPMVSGGYKRCCTEGPVFKASEVAWN